MFTFEQCYPQPKPESRATQKARQRRAYQRARRCCREEVYEREGWRCQGCGCQVSIEVSVWAPNFAHVHEEPPRSLGGDPTNPDECKLLCRLCHEARHRAVGILETK